MEAWRQYQAFGRNASDISGGHSRPFSSHHLVEPSLAGSPSIPASRASSDPHTSSNTLIEPKPTLVESKLGDSINSHLPGINPLSPASPDASPTSTYVAFAPNDPANPQNWSTAYKSWVIFLLQSLTISLTAAASFGAPAEYALMQELGGSQVGVTAVTGAFLVGTGLGAMPAAPLSERES